MSWASSAWSAKAWQPSSIENPIGPLQRNVAKAYDAALTAPGKPKSTATLRAAVKTMLVFAASKDKA